MMAFKLFSLAAEVAELAGIRIAQPLSQREVEARLCAVV